MSLQICITPTVENLKLEKSKIFKGRFKLTVYPGSECEYMVLKEGL